MTKNERLIITELIAFAEMNIESPCYGCTSRSCLGVEKCSSTKWGYEIVEKTKDLLYKHNRVAKAVNESEARQCT